MSDPIKASARIRPSALVIQCPIDECGHLMDIVGDQALCGRCGAVLDIETPAIDVILRRAD